MLGREQHMRDVMFLPPDQRLNAAPRKRAIGNREADYVRELQQQDQGVEKCSVRR